MPLKRTLTANKADIVTYGGAVWHQWHPLTADHSLSMTVHLDPSFNAHLPPSKNPVNPPYHWHYRQREDFQVQTGAIIFTLDGKDIVKTKADGIISVYPGTYHTFRADPSSAEEVSMLITTQADDHGLTERFFRNIYGYMEDCQEQKININACQLLLFLYSTDTYPVLPGPKFIARPLSRSLTWFLGVIVGKRILGLQESYSEYYKPGITK